MKNTISKKTINFINKNTLIDHLLEVLHIISSDGTYKDVEATEQVLRSVGVEQSIIDYHK